MEKAKLINRSDTRGSILGLILEGIMGGKNNRRRPRLQYISQLIIEDQGSNSHQELKRKASDVETRKE